MSRQALTPFGFEIDEQSARTAMVPFGVDVEDTSSAATTFNAAWAASANVVIQAAGAQTA